MTSVFVHSFGACVFLSLAFIIFLNRPWTGASLGYFLLATGTVWWQGWMPFVLSAKDPRWIDLFVRICYSGIIFLPITYYHFVAEFVHPGAFRRSIRWQYFMGFIFLTFLWGSNLFIYGYQTLPWGNYPTAGILHPLFLINLTVIAFLTIYLPFRSLRKLKDQPLRASQMRSMMWINLFYSFSAIDFFENYGFSTFPIGVFFTLFSVAGVMMGMLRYSLFDIKSELQQSVVVAINTLLFGFPAILIVMTTRSIPLGCVFIILAFLIGPELKQKTSSLLSAAIDRLPLFKARHASIQQIRLQENILQQTQTLEEFSIHLDQAIREVLRVRSVRLFFYDASQDRFCEKDALHKTCVSKNSPFAVSLLRSNFLMRELLTGMLPMAQAITVKNEMSSLEIEAAVPLLDSKREAIVLVGVSDKENGPLNELDMAALWHLARVAEDSAKNLLLRESLAQKNRLAAIGEMASEVSHELKTPLAVIRNSVEFLSGRLTANPEYAPFQKHIGIIKRQTDSLNNLISGILNFTRKRAFRFEPIHLQEQLSLLTSLFPFPTNVLLEKNFLSQNSWIQGDSTEVEQAVTNLLNNAVEAMPQGGKLTITTAASPTEVTVSISDTGVGIEEKDLPRLFEPFYTTKSQGTGLGLAVVKKVMDRHRGNLEVQSQPGQGSTFTLKFPIGTPS